MSRHATQRRAERAPRAVPVEEAVPVPPRVLRDIMSLKTTGAGRVGPVRRKGRNDFTGTKRKDRTKYRATASAVYVLRRDLVVTVLAVSDVHLADLLWWALTASGGLR